MMYRFEDEKYCVWKLPQDERYCYNCSIMYNNLRKLKRA